MVVVVDLKEVVVVGVDVCLCVCMDVKVCVVLLWKEFEFCLWLCI